MEEQAGWMVVETQDGDLMSLPKVQPTGDTPTTKDFVSLQTQWSSQLNPIFDQFSNSMGLVVSAHVAGFSSEWGRASSTLGPFSQNSSAGNNILDINPGSFGIPQIATNSLPQITINSLVPGTYKVTAIFSTDSSGVAQLAYAISDGVNISGKNEMSNNASINTLPSIVGVFNYLVKQNITFQIFGSASAGTVFINMGSINNQLQWIVEKIG